MTNHLDHHALESVKCIGSFAIYIYSIVNAAVHTAVIEEDQNNHKKEQTTMSASLSKSLPFNFTSMEHSTNSDNDKTLRLLQEDRANEANLGSNLLASNISTTLSAAQYEETGSLQDARQVSATIMEEAVSTSMKTTNPQNNSGGDCVVWGISSTSNTTSILSRYLTKPFPESTRTLLKAATTTDSDILLNNNLPAFHSDGFLPSERLFSSLQRWAKSTLDSSTKGSKGTCARDKYGHTFSTRCPCNFTSSQADDEGLYSMSSAHFSDTNEISCSSLLYGNKERNAGSSTKMSENSSINKNLLQPYNRGFENESQVFDSTHSEWHNTSSSGSNSFPLPFDANTGNLYSSQENVSSTADSNTRNSIFCSNDNSSNIHGNNGSLTIVAGSKTTRKNSFASKSSYHQQSCQR